MGEPFLKIGITLAIFNLSGYIPEERERLKIFTSAGARMGRDSLINLVEISSCPVELLFFRFLTVLIISVTLVLCRKIDWGAGSFRNFLCSEMFTLSNLSANCSPIS